MLGAEQATATRGWKMGTEHEDALERRRDELRRIVYGTPGEPPGDVAAELAAIEEALSARDRRVGQDEPVEPVEVVEVVGAVGHVDAVASRAAAASGTDARPGHPTGEEPGTRWRLTRGRALAASVAVLALIGVGIAVLGPTRELLSPPRGLDIFERPQTEEERGRADRVATAAQLAADAPETLRWLGRVFGYEFWGYRDADLVCLLSQRPYFFDWVEECTTVEEFRETALTRRISSDDIRQGPRRNRLQPGDVVVVSWDATSAEVEWRLEPDG
jgi:hypothetical protein